MAWIRTNVPGWVKDDVTGAIINTNTTQLEQLKQARIANRELQQLKDEVKVLKAIVYRLCKEIGIENV
jgi:hypothetical protein